MDISRLIDSRDSESPPRGNRSTASATSSTGASRPYKEPSPYTPATTYGSTPTPVTIGPYSSLLPASNGPFQRGPPLPSAQQYNDPHHGPSQQRTLYPLTVPLTPTSSSAYNSHPTTSVPNVSPHVNSKRTASATPLPGEPAKKASKWNDEETQLNVELRRTGMKWEDIAKRIPGRSSTSCRLRYQNYSEKKQEWNEEKKNTLARLYMR